MFVADFGEFSEVHVPAVGGEAGDEHFWPVLLNKPLDLARVDPLVSSEAVVDDAVDPADEAGLGPVGQMAAGFEL